AQERFESSRRVRLDGRARTGRVDLTKAIGEEVGERHVFLTHEALLRQPPLGEQAEHAADAGGGGHLDRTTLDAVDRLAVELVGVGFLHQLAFLLACHGDKHYDYVLERRGQRVLEYILEYL